MAQKIRLLETRVTWLIRGAYPFFVKKLDEQKLFFEGESDHIGFCQPVLTVMERALRIWLVSNGSLFF